MIKTEIKKIIGYKRHKFGAVRVTCKLGHRHPSKVEAMHCWSLQAQINQGVIRNLQYERPFQLRVNGHLICTHYPDFTFYRPLIIRTPTGPNSYTESTNPDELKLCVDEVKGFKTADWIIKSKLFKALYPEIEYRVIE